LDAETAHLPTFRIESPGVILRLANIADVDAIVHFYDANREHLRPWDPERPDYFYEGRFWRLQVRQNTDDFAADRALRLFLFSRPQPQRVIGNVSFTNFVRGAAHHCTLGYSIDSEFQGRGLMFEALRAAIDHVFRDLHMRRVEANYIPHNVRSGKLLRRLGFTVEGYSRDYLRIAGVWQDHVRAALSNPHWIDPPA